MFYWGKNKKLFLSCGKQLSNDEYQQKGAYKDKKKT